MDRPVFMCRSARVTHEHPTALEKHGDDVITEQQAALSEALHDKDMHQREDELQLIPITLIYCLRAFFLLHINVHTPAICEQLL